MTFLSNLAASWNLLILAVSVVTLGTFFYSFVLRRVLRARRIAHLRERRLLLEAAERESERRPLERPRN